MKLNQRLPMLRASALILALTLALTACGEAGAPPDTSPAGPGDALSGESIYAGTCRSCHGGNLAGVSGLGKPLAPSDFVSGMDEERLASFLHIGRPASDPANTTGIPMPAKGGNSSLGNQDLRDLAAFLVSRN